MRNKQVSLLRNISYMLSAGFMILALILWALPTSTVQAGPGGGPPGGGPPGGSPPGGGPPNPTQDPCENQPPGQCGTGDGGQGNPGNGSEHANCRARQGEVDPDCETETPVATETPVVTETPVETETPVATETPVVTETPIETETPVATETPVVTETPVETETPIVTETPGDDPEGPDNPRRPRVVGTPIAPPASGDETIVLIPVTGIDDSPLAASLPQTFANLSLIFFGVAMLLHTKSRRPEEERA